MCIPEKINKELKMDGLVKFLTNGRSIFWDAYSLMRDPNEREGVDQGIQALVQGMSPFRDTRTAKDDPILKKLQNVVDFTAYFSKHAAKFFLGFTILNILVYHFTRLLTFIAMTYLIGAFIFNILYLDTREIAGAAQDIKDIFDENNRTPSISRALTQQICIKAKEKEFNNLVTAKVTYQSVRLTIKRLERLSNSLILTGYLTHYPLTQIIKHLRQLETDLNEKIHPPKGRALVF